MPREQARRAIGYAGESRPEERARKRMMGGRRGIRERERCESTVSSEGEGGRRIQRNFGDHVGAASLGASSI